MCVAVLTRHLLPQFGAEMVPFHVACALLSLTPLFVLAVPPIWTQPEQVHLSYPGMCLRCHITLMYHHLRIRFPPLVTQKQNPGHVGFSFTDTNNYKVLQ